MITLYADGQQLLIYILSIFVFTKIYEGVVTVNGEDLEDNDRIYYNLAYDSLELQFKILEFLINYYTNKTIDKKYLVIEKYLGDGKYYNTNKKIVKMLKRMRSSLFDKEIGNLDKSIFRNGKFKRKYPTD